MHSGAAKRGGGFWEIFQIRKLAWILPVGYFFGKKPLANQNVKIATIFKMAAILSIRF